MKLKTAAICFFLLVSVALPQQNIKEEVSVNWWVIPLFAVTKGDNPVLDLNETDIELKVNHHLIKKFMLIKRSFQASKETIISPTPPLEAKKKMVFLIFDTAFSTKTNLEKSKIIAQRMVQHAENTTRFVVMTIHPYDGLVYLYGPSNQKSQILETITHQVKWAIQAKSIFKIMQISRAGQIEGRRGAKFTEGEMRFRMEEIAHSLKNTNQRYFKSFKTLYYVLSSMSDHKFVYFFSEGISLFARKVIRSAEGEYRKFTQIAAKNLNRSGAVLVIINPSGSQESFFSLGSGEDSMRYFAKESGGKYLEGERESIINRIDNMHRAYYEIAFPELDLFKGNIRKISIQSKKPGIKIHTLKSTEKPKSYSDMKIVEKEIFALNIIYRNPFFEKRIHSEDVIIKKIVTRKKKKIYQILIPKSWIDTEIDLYKAWVKKDPEEVNIHKSVLVPTKTKIKIEFKAIGKTNPYFILINLQANSALVKGIEYIKNETLDFNTLPEIKPMTEKSIDNVEFGYILDGAGDYCKKLRKSVFHFVCKEKVVETFDVFRAGIISDISFYENRASDRDMLRRQNAMTGSRRKLVKKVLYDYQLINEKGKIREQRRLLSKNEKSNRASSSTRKLGEFISERAIFAPLTLLEKKRQPIYTFKLIKFEKVKGILCAVLEAVPQKREEAIFVYGQVWINADDFSVMKIKANPRSIKGFQHLNTIARSLMAKLFLDLEIHFDRIYNGIRFPSQVILKEVYKGGPHITRHRGSKGWERNNTVYTYHDYRFFKVGVDVIEE